MKTLTLFLIFFLSTFLSFSQYIEGRVLDANTNKPIEGVHVFMKGINRGASTNEKGNYYIKFPYKIIKEDIIQFSHMTYETLEVPYVQKKKNYSVRLITDLKKLEEVKIYQKRNLKKYISYKKLSSMKSGVHSFGSLLKSGEIYVVGGDVSVSEDVFKKTLEYYPDINDFGDFLDIAGRYASFAMNKYSSDLQLYNITSDKWEKSDLKFSKRAYHNLNLYNNKIYILGGKRLSKGKRYEYLDDKIEVFDLDTENIVIDNTNPHQAVNFASFTYKDNIIVLGGSIKMKKNGFKEYSNKVHLYNLKTGKWFELGNMPVAKELSGVLIEDKIYILGGFNKKPLVSIESFDLLTQKWKKEGELFYGVAKPAITHNNTIIYFYDNGKISTYNVLTKELNEYLIDLSVKSPELYYSNNKLYILGGFERNIYSYYPSSNLYHIDINKFNKTRIHNSKTL
ncbi:carboxypeptidase-like regulatory domain-containing protein [Lutibacter sp.]|uniref:carboxypeptidase-like regulatory domain-containing protein n=1 Tax=Lutibacter sp. TaxID=1925666 RepID=UPI0025C07134|nr:carboxypeptidase-like regulatory domain-containing protein [Lutibacter sp.]MCF6168382.1 carboxypeptidase-like regulatory domain-containing protein [Lutibacter sp.]